MLQLKKKKLIYLKECWNLMQVAFSLSKNTPSLIYFMVLFNQIFFFEQGSNLMDLPLFIWSWFALIDFKINFLYIIIPLLFPINSTFLGTIFVIMGIFSSKNDSQLVLFMILLGESFTSGSKTNPYFLFVSSFLILLSVYHRFIFPSLQENMLYFNGFFIVFVYSIFTIISAQLNILIPISIQLIIIFPIFKLSRHLLENRLEKIISTNFSQLRCEGVKSIYIQLIQNQHFCLHKAQILFENHKIECVKVDCWCHQYGSNSKKLIQSLYTQALEVSRQYVPSKIMEDYFSFLIKNQQTIKAIYLVNKFKRNYNNNVVLLQKIQAQLKEYFYWKISSIYHFRVYDQALKYDKFIKKLIQQICYVIELKDNFFRQIVTLQPRVNALQRNGLGALQQMNKLNKFYFQNIKQKETLLKQFEATAIYTTYLFSITNHKENATQILKDTTRLIENCNIQLNNYGEIGVLSAVIDINSHKHNQQQFSMLIDETNNGLCKMLNHRKIDLIGKQIETIMPKGYRQFHKRRMKQLLLPKDNRISSIAEKLQILHQSLPLPFRGASGNVVMATIFLRLHNDFNKGFTFILNVRQIKTNSSLIIIDGEGNTTQMPSNFNSQMLGHSSFKDYLNNAKKTWILQRVIPSQSFYITKNTVNYKITMSAPHISFFVNNSDQQIVPPIIVEIQVENIQFRLPKRKDLKIKKVANLMTEGSGNQTVESQAKGGNYTIKCLNNFQERLTIPLYQRVTLAIFAVSTIGCTTIVLFSKLSILPWDNTMQLYNPVSDLTNMMKIQNLALQALIKVQNVISIHNSSVSLNMSLLHSYFGVADYIQYMIQDIKYLRQNLNNVLYLCLSYNANITKNVVNSIFKRQIHLQINSTRITPNFSYLQLMLNYVTDLQVIKHSINQNINLINKTLIVQTYNQNLINVQNTDALNDFINSKISQLSTLNIILFALFISIMIIAILALSLLFRGRKEMHLNIYDLLISVESKEIINERANLRSVFDFMKKWKRVTVKDESRHQDRDILQRYSEKSILQNLQKFKEKDVIQGDINEVQSAALSRPMQIEQKKIYHRTSIENINKTQSDFITKNVSVKSVKNRDLRASGSEYENKIINLNSNEYIIIMTTCIFILLLVIIFCYSNTNLQKIQQTKDKMRNIINFSNQNSLAFLLGIRFLRNQQTQNRNILPPWGIKSYLIYNHQNMATSSFLQQLIQVIGQLPKYSLPINADQIYQNCSKKAIRSKFCQFYCNYHQIYSQFGALYKQLNQKKLYADSYLKNNQSAYGRVLVQINQRIFYLQTLFDQLQDHIMKIVADDLNSMLKFSQINAFKINILFIMGIIWTMICIILGIILVKAMKFKYMSEVCMISLLSHQMLLMNKRISSFISNYKIKK